MMKTKLTTIMKLMWLWPPFLGAGVRVKKFNPEVNQIEVEMKLYFGNNNYMHTHFGGSLYSMTDPFFAFILIHNLGREYVVWDKEGTIRYKKPGRGRVSAKFIVTLERLNEIRLMADTESKVEPKFYTEIIDEKGEVIAEVEKILYVRRKDKINKSKKMHKVIPVREN